MPWINGISLVGTLGDLPTRILATIQQELWFMCSQGGSGTWIPNQGLGGGGPAEGRKKKVTPINSMLEVVSDVPLATSDGFS